MIYERKKATRVMAAGIAASRRSTRRSRWFRCCRCGGISSSGPKSCAASGLSVARGGAIRCRPPLYCCGRRRRLVQDQYARRNESARAIATTWPLAARQGAHRLLQVGQVDPIRCSSSSASVHIALMSSRNAPEHELRGQTTRSRAMVGPFALKPHPVIYHLRLHGRPAG
jgi:hypothetical protein